MYAVCECCAFSRDYGQGYSHRLCVLLQIVPLYLVPCKSPSMVISMLREERFRSQFS